MHLRRHCTNLVAASLRLEDRAEGQPPIITGYGLRFWDPNDAGTEYRLDLGRYGLIIERVMPGAVTRSIGEDDIVGLFNHDVNHILGRTSAGTMKLALDDKGLRYDIDPPANSPVVDSIRRKDVKGSSFSFTVRAQTWKEEKIGDKDVTIRELTDIQLYDVGPVVFPAYSASSTGVRAYDPAEMMRELEAFRESRTDPAAKIALYKRQLELAEIL